MYLIIIKDIKYFKKKHVVVKELTVCFWSMGIGYRINKVDHKFKYK